MATYRNKAKDKARTLATKQARRLKVGLTAAETNYPTLSDSKDAEGPLERLERALRI